MRLAAALVAVVLGGCDALFGLEDVHPSIDAQPQIDASMCFVERFDNGTIDTQRWDLLSPADPTVAISEESNGVVARIVPGTTGYNGLVGKQSFDMIDGSVQVEVMPAYMGGFVETIFVLDVSSLAQFLFSAGAGNLNFKATINNAPISTLVAYTSEMKFWRFAHHVVAQQIVMQTSPDGVAWTDRMIVQTTYSPTAAKVQLTAGEYNAGLPAATSARWEGLRVITPACP